MTLSEAIRERRSIRKFKPGITIPKEQIDLILEAAMMAPSACNSRPWEFFVAQDGKTLNDLMKLHPSAPMLKNASLAIIICAKPGAAGSPYEGYFPQDCGAAAQNILLQAADLGLGSCWCGIYPREDRVESFKEFLKIESIPFCLIAIGVPDESPKARGHYEADRVKFI